VNLLRRLLRAAYRGTLPVSVQDALSLERDLARRDSGAQPLDVPTSRRVIVLAPHADDEVFGCGGFMALAVGRSCDVRVVFMTDGSKGYDAAEAGGDRASFEAALVARRKAEASRAGALLGLGEPVFLDLADGAAGDSPGAAEKLAEVLGDLSPELVLLPYFADGHPDHWATVKHFVNAAQRARLPSSLPCWGYEVWTPLVANGFVDITAAMPLKQAAMAVYESQIGTTNYPRAISGLNAYRALGAGLTSGCAEAFHVDTLSGYTRRFHQTWPQSAA